MATSYPAAYQIASLATASLATYFNLLHLDVARRNNIVLFRLAKFFFTLEIFHDHYSPLFSQNL